MNPSLLSAYAFGRGFATTYGALERLFEDSHKARRAGKRDLYLRLHHNARAAEYSLDTAALTARDTFSGTQRSAFLMGLSSRVRRA